MGLFSKLQNGDTVLKSLKFGNDRPGGGDSGQPYIQDPIPLINSPANTDFVLRGGINAPLSAAQDVARLTKYMFNPKSPSGLLFTAKQNLLSRISPKTESSKGIGYAGGVLNNGVYTPLSTLAQAGVGFLGGHVNKQGLDPTGLISSLSIKNYGDVLKNQPKEENRLVNILSGSVKDLNGVKGYDINQGQDVITYGGGPGSILGVGKTHIRYADQRTGINNSLFKSNKNYFLKGGKTAPSTYIVKDEVGNYKFTDTLNYNNLLGASVKEGLDDTQTGIDPKTGTNFNIYGPDKDNSTLSKYNPTGISLSGSKGYQSDRLYSILSHNLSPTYISPINTILNSSGEGNTTGVSGSGRQLVTDLKYDQNIGTFVLQNNEGKNLGGYSSENTLWNDNLNESYEVSPKHHEKGYLANLDKNAGYYITDKGKYTFALAQYPRNIAPDFRKTDRATRGFTDFSTPVKGTGYVRGSYDIITTTGSNYTDTDNYVPEKTIDQIYYSSEQRRKSRKINDGFDLIKFNITVINPKSPSTSFTPLIFRAYIDSFSDSYSADWASQAYMGRGEKFYKYNTFSRDMSLSFKIVADSKDNLGIMYSLLNTLASSLAPTYTDSGYMAGNLHKLTVGNYIASQFGIINSLSYDIMEESPWEIEKDNQLPMYIAVSMKFTPIHNFRPESQFSGTHQFINQA